MSGRRRGTVTTRVVVVGLGLVGLGWLMHRMPVETPGRGWWPWLVLAGVVLLVGAVWWWMHRRTGSAGSVAWRGRRNQGVASRWAIVRSLSGWALRRQARALRPSLRAVSWCRRWFGVSLRELGTPLARVGLLRVWSSCEDVALRVGGPRVGKTGEIAGRILDVPGAVIATSTRTDLVELTGPVRVARYEAGEPLVGRSGPRPRVTRAGAAA